MNAERLYLIAVGVLLVSWTSGCRERNPAYIGRDATVATDVSEDARSDSRLDGRNRDVADASATADALDAPADGNAIADAFPDTAPDTIPDVPQDDGRGPDGSVTDARDAGPRDLRDARRDDGPGDSSLDQIFADTPADVPGVVDVSLDGASDDGGAPGIDAATMCQDLQTRDCATPGNPLLGACRAGVQTCSGGAWGPCVGEVTPSGETCNGLDDNCNGMVDEGCTAGCVVVSPSGDDAAADGSVAHPFATIAAAMAFASAPDGGSVPRICVAAGATCSERKTYALAEPLDILDGASVQGNYAIAGNTLVSCAGAFPPITTLQLPATGEGVRFGADILSAELGGFTLARQTAASPTAGDLAAIVVRGGKVRLSTLLVGDQSGADNTYGVDVEGGDVTLTVSSVVGGQGSAQAVGVLVNGGTLNLRNNCAIDGNGLCPSSCPTSTTVLGIRGRNSPSGGAAADSAAESSAVYVQRGSASIVGNNLCGGGGNASDAGKDGNLATLRCENAACKTIAANAIAATTSNVRQVAALSLLDGPAVVDGNLILGGCASDVAVAVLLDNAPARLQNNRISGTDCSGGGTYYGVRVVLGAADGEPDLNGNAIEPAGGTGNCQSIGLAVETSGSDPVAATILRNTIVSTGTCRRRVAVSDGSPASARLVENNDLYASATTSTVDSTVLYRRGDTSAVTAAQINALTGATKNIATNPLYMSFPSDLRLSSNSPCIDRGTLAGAADHDVVGHPRPIGAAVDIGAYEFVAP